MLNENESERPAKEGIWRDKEQGRAYRRSYEVQMTNYEYNLSTYSHVPYSGKNSLTSVQLLRREYFSISSASRINLIYRMLGLHKIRCESRFARSIFVESLKMFTNSNVQQSSGLTNIGGSVTIFTHNFINAISLILWNGIFLFTK